MGNNTINNSFLDKHVKSSKLGKIDSQIDEREKRIQTQSSMNTRNDVRITDNAFDDSLQIPKLPKLKNNLMQDSA